MNDYSKPSEAEIKKAKTMKFVRLVWMILIPVFAATILLRLYNYSDGKENLSGVLSPLGLMLFGIASLIGERYKALRTALIAVAMFSVITALILLFIR